MALYAFKCDRCGVIERRFPIGKALESVSCGPECGQQAPRYIGPDAMPQIVATDPFRAFDLSPRKERAQIEQQRYVEAPRDKFEAKRAERDLGRVYVGDSTDGMSASARRGIERAKEKAK